MDVEMDLTDVERMLAGYAERYQHDGPDALLAGLGRIVAPGAFRCLIAALLDDERHLSIVARRSYRHDNGFIKLVLVSTARYQLRLHIWPGSEVGARSGNVHNHRWDFAAVLLQGGYNYQEFHESHAGERYFAYTYQAARGNGSYSLSPAGTRQLGCTFDAFLAPGTAYLLSAEVLHRVFSRPDQPALSLILQGPSRRPAVDVLSAGELTTGPAIAIDQLSPDYLVCCLRGALAMLEGADKCVA